MCAASAGRRAESFSRRMMPRLLNTSLCLLVICRASLYGISVIPEQYTAPARFGNLLLFSQRTGSELYAIEAKSKRDVWVWSSDRRSVRTRPTVVNGKAYIWAGNMMENRKLLSFLVE